MDTKTGIVALALLGIGALEAKAQHRVYFNVPSTPMPPVFRLPTSAQLGLGLTQRGVSPFSSALVPKAGIDSLIARRRVCPMPVFGVDSSRADRMPVVVPDSTIRNTMPVVDLRCDNPLRR